MGHSVGLLEELAARLHVMSRALPHLKLAPQPLSERARLQQLGEQLAG